MDDIFNEVFLKDKNTPLDFFFINLLLNYEMYINKRTTNFCFSFPSLVIPFITQKKCFKKKMMERSNDSQSERDEISNAISSCISL